MPNGIPCPYHLVEFISIGLLVVTYHLVQILKEHSVRKQCRCWSDTVFQCDVQIRPWGWKLFSYSTQLSTKFILLINVKMPTTLISMINTTSERLKARNFFICRYFGVNEQVKFRAQLSWSWKKLHNLQSLTNGQCPIKWTLHEYWRHWRTRKD